MAAYYLDTSALVKRYTREQGSTWVLAQRQAGSAAGLLVENPNAYP